jgi:hypothetical protein
VAGNPRRNALFSVVPETCGLQRLDGGGRSQVRTYLDPGLPDKWLFTGYFRELLPVIAKSTRIPYVDSKTYKQIP